VLPTSGDLHHHSIISSGQVFAMVPVMTPKGNTTARLDPGSTIVEQRENRRALYHFANDPAQQQAAWEFIKYITGPEGTTITVQGMDYLSACKRSVNRPDRMAESQTQHHTAAVAFRQLDDEMAPRYDFPGRGGTRIYKLVQDAIRKAFLGEAPKMALDEAAEAANRLMHGRSS
jgi:hypothetical protein